MEDGAGVSCGSETITPYAVIIITSSVVYDTTQNLTQNLDTL